MEGGLFGPGGFFGHKEQPQPSRVPAQPAIAKTRMSQHSPDDAGALCLSMLRPEIVSAIMDIIQQESPASLSSIALVNSSFYHLARYSQFRLLSFDVGLTRGNIDKIAELRALPTYLENASLLPAVRELRLSAQNDRADEEDVSRIGTLILKLPGLTDIVWHISKTIPDTVLQHLQTRPNVRLHTRAVHLGNRRQAASPPGRCHFLDQLENCVNLHSLEVVQGFTSADECLAVTAPLRLILLSCPNLRRLKLDLGLPTGGCVAAFLPREYCGVGFLDGQRPLAALEELELVNYPFGTPPPADPPGSVGTMSRFNSVYCDGYPLAMREEDYWVHHFDWSHIQRLVGPSGLVMGLMPRLTSVREVVLTKADDQKQRQTLYAQVPAALEAITVSTLAGVDDLHSVLRHGPSLRKLQIHQTERWTARPPTWADGAVGLQALGAIRESCPLLEELGIDLARDGAWPYAAFDVLASFPALRRLELWFELGISDQKHPARPYTTFHAAREIAQYLLNHSPRSPPSLRVVKINAGAPPSLGFGYPGPAALWPAANSTSCVCKLSDRDDEAVKRFSHTTCTKVGKAGNKFLDATEPGLDQDEFGRRLEAFSNTEQAAHEYGKSRARFGPINMRSGLASISLAYHGPRPA